jgi:hypothetical protein
MADGAELAASDPVMNAATKVALVMALIAVVTLFMFFGGGVMTGGFTGMPGSDGMRRIGWMWIPIFLPFGLGILLGWFIFGKK